MVGRGSRTTSGGRSRGSPGVRRLIAHTRSARTRCDTRRPRCGYKRARICTPSAGASATRVRPSRWTATDTCSPACRRRRQRRSTTCFPNLATTWPQLLRYLNRKATGPVHGKPMPWRFCVARPEGLEPPTLRSEVSSWSWHRVQSEAQRASIWGVSVASRPCRGTACVPYTPVPRK